MLTRSAAAFALALLVTNVSAQGAPEAFVAGRDYAIIEPAVPTADAAKIEVIEVFAYTCIHCANVQPFVSDWKAKLPDDVDFSYAPLGFGGVGEAFARAHFAADVLGLNDRAHDALFKAVHVERREFRSPADIAAFYVQYDVSQANFEQAMRSFAVNTRLNRLKQQIPRYGVEGTPTMIVNGKYRVQMPRQGGPQGLLAIVDFLVAKERAARAGG